MAPFSVQHLLELRGRHEMRVIAQTGHDLRQFRGQHIACIHGNKLPDLHRRPAHLRKLLSDAGDILWCEKQIAHCWPFCLHQL